MTARAVVAATSGCSGADLATLVRGAVRRVVLDSHSDLDAVVLEAALERLRGRAQADDAEARADYCRISREMLGSSQREIAARLGVSHVTIGNVLRDHVDRTGRPRRPSKEGRT